MSNLCLQCQYENRDAAHFCAECGAELAIEQRAASPDRLEAAPDGVDGDLGAETLVVGREPHLTWYGHTFAAGTEDVTEYVTDGTVPAGADIGIELDPESVVAAEAPGGRKFPQGVFLLVGQRSDLGDMRRDKANEDSLFVLTAAAVSSSLTHPTLGLYVVADGMGGHMDGEVASRTACEVIAADLLAALGLPTLGGYVPDAVLDLLGDALRSANHQIYAAAAADGSNMGTTAVLALVVDDQAYFANVGDSRAYLWRASELYQLTEDHSHVYALLKNGLIQEGAIYTHPRRNEIFRSLGAAPTVEVDCCRADLAPGDLLLLCSDGLWEMLRSEGIADVLELNLGDPQVICDELVRRANLAGGDDNISAIVVRVVIHE